MLRSKPITWAMKMTATHSSKAVPSMFMVAPMGRTKLVTLLLTPAFFSTSWSVTGRVAAELLVENAVSRASATLRK